MMITINLNLAFHFNHSQLAKVCIVHNKHFSGKGNDTFLSSFNICFPYSLVKNMSFTEPGSSLQNYHFFTEFWWDGNVQITTVCLDIRKWNTLCLDNCYWISEDNVSNMSTVTKVRFDWATTEWLDSNSQKTIWPLCNLKLLTEH